MTDPELDQLKAQERALWVACDEAEERAKVARKAWSVVYEAIEAEVRARATEALVVAEVARRLSAGGAS